MSLQANEERDDLYNFVSEEAAGAARILDCACAEGYGTDIIAARNPQSACLGIDLNASAIAAARGEFQRPNLEFQAGDALGLKLPDASFDAVVSCHTIEHFDAADQKKLLREYLRVLKPGGKFVIATPDVDVWRLMGIAGQQADHVRELTKEEFMEEVVNAGFKIDKVCGQNPLKEGNFSSRKFLNLLKKADIFRVRKLLGGLTRAVDQNTRPIEKDSNVVPLPKEAKASVTVLCARKS